MNQKKLEELLQGNQNLPDIYKQLQEHREKRKQWEEYQQLSNDWQRYQIQQKQRNDYDRFWDIEKERLRQHELLRQSIYNNLTYKPSPGGELFCVFNTQDRLLFVFSSYEVAVRKCLIPGDYILPLSAVIFRDTAYDAWRMNK